MKLIKKVAIIGFATFALSSTVAFGADKPAPAPATDTAATDACRKSTTAAATYIKPDEKAAVTPPPAAPAKSGKTDG